MEQEYLKLLKNPFTENTTSDGYEHNILKHIIPYFEKINLFIHELERNHIQEFVNYMYKCGRMDGKGGLKVTSIKKYVSNISSALKQAVIDKLISENPCILIRYPKEAPFEAKFLNLNELEKLLKAVSGAVIESAIIFAVYYALRRGKILGIRWKDINFESNILYIKNTRVRVARKVEKFPKNKASLAPMPLMPFVKEFLINLKKYQDAQAKLFGTQYIHNDYICMWEDGRPFEYKYIKYCFRAHS